MPKLLLVEDNQMNRDMLSRRFARMGCEVAREKPIDFPCPLAKIKALLPSSY